MSQEVFEQQHQHTWKTLQQWLATEPRNRKEKDSREIPHYYRQVCYHLALAKSRMYSPVLIERLNNLALSAHAVFYRTRSAHFNRLFHFLGVEFPSLVRKDARLVWLSFFLLFAPMAIMMLLIQQWPDLVYSVMGPEQVADIEEMYNPAAHKFGRSRDSGSDFEMFGFYIFNNIGISFKIFAGGLLLGVGTLFFILLNGVYIGTVVGHLLYIGYHKTILSFIAGHSSFELLGFVIAGAAGFKLALAVVNPGRLPRSKSLKNAAAESVKLIYGVIAMLVLAAFVEAFWSSTREMPVQVKYWFGGALWVLFFLYFTFAGRRHAA